MNDSLPLTYGLDGGRRKGISARTFFFVVAVLVVAVAVWLAVTLSMNELDRRRVERRVRQELEAAIPVGTPVWQAHASLDQIRPHVERRSSDSFGDRKQLDFLYLRWNDSGKYLHTMEAAVVHRDGLVTEVIVRSDSNNMGK